MRVAASTAGRAERDGRFQQEEVARATSTRRAVAGAVQTRLKTKLTGAEYITRQAWLDGSAPECPWPGTECELAPHGTYGGRPSRAGTGSAAALHHNAGNAAHSGAVRSIGPDTVLVSAGVVNQYGHTHQQAPQVYRSLVKRVYSTNLNGDVSLWTSGLCGNLNAETLDG